MTAFTGLLQNIPYNATSQNATGIFATIVRAMGHILYLTADLNRPTPILTEEEQLREITDAKGHLANTGTALNQSPGLTDTARDQMAFYVAAITAAETEFPGWTPAQRKEHITNLAHRTAALAAQWDRELAGRADADPGLSL